MKITLVAIGSRGDLQPYLALGLGLQAAGHVVRLASARNEAAFVAAHGLPFWPLEVDVRQLLDQGVVGDTRGGNNPLRFFWNTLRPPAQVRALQRAVQRGVTAACASADAVVYHPGQGLPFYLAQAAGQLSVLAAPFPMVATAHYPAILFYRGWQWGGRLNQLTHRLFDRLFWALARTPAREYWQQHHASRPDFSTSALRQQLRSGQPVLLGYSPLLFAPDPAWEPHVRVTGAWTLPPDPNFQPSPALAAFLAAGPAPFYVGFGSMKNDPASLIALVAEVVRRTGRRAVLGLGWSRRADDAPLPPQLLLVESVPHAWLFPRMSAVVHHGGAGTVHAGLAAGRPTVVVPHLGDQPAWGQRVFELGVGSRPIPREKLTAEKLVAALAAVWQPAVVAAAHALGQRLSQENGVAQAVAAIEGHQSAGPGHGQAATASVPAPAAP